MKKLFPVLVAIGAGAALLAYKKKKDQEKINLDIDEDLLNDEEVIDMNEEADDCCSCDDEEDEYDDSIEVEFYAQEPVVEETDEEVIDESFDEVKKNDVA